MFSADCKGQCKPHIMICIIILAIVFALHDTTRSIQPPRLHQNPGSFHHHYCSPS